MPRPENYYKQNTLNYPQPEIAPSDNFGVQKTSTFSQLPSPVSDQPVEKGSWKPFSSAMKGAEKILGFGDDEVWDNLSYGEKSEMISNEMKNIGNRIVKGFSVVDSNTMANMTFEEQQKYALSQMRKGAAKLAVSLTANILKTPLVLEQSFADLASTITGYDQRPDSYEIPGLGRVGEFLGLKDLGKVEGAKGRYKKQREAGFTPYQSGFSAVGSVAGDIARGFLLVDILNSVFNPSVAKISDVGEVGLNQEQIEQIKAARAGIEKNGVTKISDTTIATPEQA